MTSPPATAPTAPDQVAQSAPTIPVVTPDMDFETAARLVIDYLNTHVPLAMWAVTRVENRRQTFLFVDQDNGYAATPGDTGPWEDSYCVRMEAGLAPNVAPDAQAVPVYAAAPVNRTTRIGAYGGAPIYEPAGSLFGVLCGIDPERRLDESFAQSGPLLMLLGQLLSLVLAAERVREGQCLSLLEATLAAETDALTCLYNRRAWSRILQEEERRFQRLADPTVAVMLDLDLLKTVNDTEGHAAGDRYIQRAGTALLASVKDTDVVARLGGDEFGVLLRGCTESQAEGAVTRMYRALSDAGVAGSIGWAPITVLKGFPAALAEADAAMYAAKAARRAHRAAADIATR
ncbi:MAG TPA: GGDEF domain-containing protein [Nocardioidaceae bacterium]|nr:GGDEF domain-containing protein [Nocardioidaceae bacterium]